MRIKEYDREKAVEYATKWALKRSPKYYDFSSIGGDCTNYISQCLYAGSNIMNFAPVTGWYYVNANNRTASWTDVDYLYKFLSNNKGVGPFCEQINQNELSLGDLVQLGNSETDFYHSLIVTKIDNYKNIYLSSHSIDRLNQPIQTLNFNKIRYLKIKGVRI